MGRAIRFVWPVIAMVACHATPSPRPLPQSSSLADRRAALERADAEPASVTPEWVMLQVAELETIGGDTALANAERAEAFTLAAKAEGVLIEHFTTLFWNKADPGRRVIADLRQALALDPSHEGAAVAYTFSVLGIRNSGFRSQAEDTMEVRTTPELVKVAPLLAAHRESLLAQSVLRAAIVALREDGPLPPDTEALGVGLDEHIATLRARDVDIAKSVDAQLDRHAR